MTGQSPWACCLRPKVAEHDQAVDAIKVTPRTEAGQPGKCTEDSANADGFAKLRCSTVRDTDTVAEDAEEFASPASSYATCFSEEDPVDLSSRSFRRPSLSAEREGDPAPASASRVGNTDWLSTELGVAPAWRRDRLPEHGAEIPSVNLWTLIKDWIGKDIHKLALPTHLNEPLTDLQRRVEAFEYSEVVDQAARMPPRSLERLLYVAAFAVSMLSTIKRVQKPFKNLQNSTYELVYPEKGLRAIGEKVRHIPMVHVCHIEGRGWEFDANDEFHMELWGNHARIRPTGELYIQFQDGDEYCWSTASTYINNLLIGNRNLDHRGSFHVTCLHTNDSIQCTIKEPLLGKSTHEVKGHLERQGREVEGVRVFGRWDESLSVEFPGGTRKQLWKANPPYKLACRRHHFPLFTTQLNDLTPELKAKLPPTDDRLRPDMRLFEHGLYYEANDEKLRLEEKQRQERTAAEAAGRPWQARWFEQVAGGQRGLETWRYKGGYWEAREMGNWENCRDIYGPGPKDMQPPKLLF